MANKLELIRNNDALDISDGVAYIHLENDSLGMPPFHRLKTRGPMQHGQTDLGYRLDPREIPLVVIICAEDWATQYARRDALLAKLSPGDDPIFLRHTRDDGTVRQIAVWTKLGPTFASTEMYAKNLKVGFLLEADDPLFYDPAGHAITFILGGGSASGTVPRAIPRIVGSDTLNQSDAFTYAGNALCYPSLIRMKGPITDPVVTIAHGATSEILDFTGTTINAGDYFDIDPRFEYKTVVDSTGANQIAALTEASQLDTFHIAPDPEAPDGVNTITVTGSSVSSATEISISYLDYYHGA